jgi:hypothetical protein
MTGRKVRGQLLAFWIHPTKSKKRTSFLSRAAGRSGRTGTMMVKILAAWRHPGSAGKRRAYVLRRIGGLADHDVSASMSPPDGWWNGLRKPHASLGDVPGSSAGGGTVAADALHARLYECYVGNALGEFRAPEYVGLSESKAVAEASDVKLIAYYLPQFHPIAENDAWWGKGFTEWRNVARAYPHFDGHYQPRVPGELGYYDLRVADVMRRQVELAKNYGIGAFCFHFYWFGGKRLLELPIRNYLNNKDIDLPFCLCWANENWSRRWDGGEGDVLISQQHSAEDDVAFLTYLDRYFRDDRYLKVNGRPVLTIYRPSSLPDARESAIRWRQTAEKLGYPGIYLIATNAFDSGDQSLGFDALSEFPPHGTRAPNIQNKLELSKFRSGWRVRSYASIVESEKGRPPPAGVVHPGVMPSWDNSPRRPANGEIVHGSTPALFRDWLEHAIRLAAKNPENQRFVFINAWNEWAEGAYLEPDARYGYAYLNACGSALAQHVDELSNAKLRRRLSESCGT